MLFRSNRVPNIFLNPKDRGKSFGLFDYFKITKQIDYLLDRTAKIVKEEALRADIQEDPTNLIMNSKKFVLTFLDFLKYTERNPTTNSEGIQTENPAQITLERVYRKLVNDPIWNEISPEKLRIMVHNASFRFKNDPELGQLWKELRRFNRLNHRKLFLVETEDRKSGCFFLGGRNLGDNYLRDENGTFLDGEVFLCRHHGADRKSTRLNSSH